VPSNSAWSSSSSFFLDER
jgi:hypothetical protein